MILNNKLANHHQWGLSKENSRYTHLLSQGVMKFSTVKLNSVTSYHWNGSYGYLLRVRERETQLYGAQFCRMLP